MGGFFCLLNFGISLIRPRLIFNFDDRLSPLPPILPVEAISKRGQQRVDSYARLELSQCSACSIDSPLRRA
jgi:hypothetical protein